MGAMEAKTAKRMRHARLLEVLKTLIAATMRLKVTCGRILCGDGNGRLSGFPVAIVDIFVKKRMVDADSPDEDLGRTSAIVMYEVVGHGLVH